MEGLQDPFSHPHLRIFHRFHHKPTPKLTILLLALQVVSILLERKNKRTDMGKMLE